MDIDWILHHTTDINGIKAILSSERPALFDAAERSRREVKAAKVSTPDFVDARDNGTVEIELFLRDL